MAISETQFAIVASVILIPLILVLYRLVICLPSCHYVNRDSTSVTKKDFGIAEGKKILIFLGSGGHTGEMFRILENCNPSLIKTVDRIYVGSSGDNTSQLKMINFENSIDSKNKSKYFKLTRARNIHESIPITILHTLQSFISTVRLLLVLLNTKAFPDILLLNGPGTSVPLAYTIFVFKVLGLTNCKIIYIESLARVENLSLSGKLLLPITDRFIVQWKKLADKYRRCEYYGILV
ncbi:unnamed protein product [[Candida] boidinii]|uniref:UDP-N-acetylglucosamine transferase subunit ALG14 n=1 Tax=Candida boidinii TaxID=5477 RepID=A0A9W6SW33_CANBO|nr:hypothetical protein B5S30_g3855 [[Candida] boidinii]OWB84705.1 hypothetical protein B5S33_g3355 [[Candida] boidinii]GME67394.1 unnamed protein product [[Candida] boidinii]GMG02788.1 unnamed protein product [[Candida] boidinii]